jgi:hypothetical protein
MSERGDLALLDEDVVDGDDDLAVDRWPVVGLGRHDDEVAVQTHVQSVVLADVGVVPVQAGVGEADLVGEVAANGDRFLGLVRHTVVLVIEPKAVPVDRRLDVSFISDMDGDLRALRDSPSMIKR